MKKSYLIVLGLIAAAGLGVGLDRLVLSPKPPPAPSPQPAVAQNVKPPTPPAVVDDPKAVYRVPLEDSPSRGPADALVTIVESIDFECPFCKRAAPTVKQIEEAYKGKIRWVYKANPLSMHKNSVPAAAVAEEARVEGGDAKFWAMHDKLLAAEQLDRPALEKLAGKGGLSVDKVRDALDGYRYIDRMRRDQTLTNHLGANVTPVFFINGRKVIGALPFENFKTVIDEEMKKAEELVKKGVAPEDVYAKTTEGGATERVTVPAPQQPAAGQQAQITLRSDDAFKGPDTALVTVALFSDFQCPFCSRVEPTLKQVEETYKGKVRFVWRNLPLPFHPNALPAAKVSEAARMQGKFWEMHDKLFANQQALSDAKYTQYAKELGLDLARFQRDQAGESAAKRIAEDQQVASSVGATGTPTLFLNCRKLVGAQPFDAMKAAIDDELKKAEALVAKGEKPGPGLYDKLCSANAAAAPPAEAEAAPRQDVKVAVRSDDPARGAKNARVTVVEFSDFQCPFCSRAVAAVKELEQAHGSDVRLVWKHMPLPMHQNAVPAAVAAEAARQQGKFWEMHDKLFANQQALSDATYEKYAQDLKLDMKRFKAALQAPATRARVDEDIRAANAAGVNGTPTFIVNGEVVVGSNALRAAVDRQLEKARLARR
jgi:protein-disulfide isomerase